MDKDNWYKDRILWKAKKNDLFSHEKNLERKCFRLEELSEEILNILTFTISDSQKIALVFWSSRSLWTMLGTTYIYSSHSESVSKINLDNIKGIVEISDSETLNHSEVKLSSQYLLLGDSRTPIWCPEGKYIFGLMNILLMFPLGSPK